jgi:hypothetical protein
VSIEALVDVENHDNPETIRLKKYLAGRLISRPGAPGQLDLLS